MLPVDLQPDSSLMLFPELASEAAGEAGALWVTSSPSWAMPKSGCLQTAGDLCWPASFEGPYPGLSLSKGEKRKWDVSGYPSLPAAWQYAGGFFQLDTDEVVGSRAARRGAKALSPQALNTREKQTPVAEHCWAHLLLSMIPYLPKIHCLPAACR